MTPAAFGRQACSAGPAKTQYSGRYFKDLPAVGGKPEKQGLDLSLQQKGQVENTSSALPQLRGSTTLRIPRFSLPVTGSSAPRHLPTSHQWTNPLSPAASNFAAWEAQGHCASFHSPVSDQLGRQLQEPAPRAPSSQWVAKPGATSLTASREHPRDLLLQDLCTPGRQLAASAAGGASHCPTPYRHSSRHPSITAQVALLQA